MLLEERQFYDEQLEEWLSKFPGRFVLIKGRELVGVFDTFNDALKESARRFGLASVLIRRVEATPEPVKLPALTLGMISADFTRPARGSDSDA